LCERVIPPERFGETLSSRLRIACSRTIQATLHDLAVHVGTILAADVPPHHLRTVMQENLQGEASSSGAANQPPNETTVAADGDHAQPGEAASSSLDDDTWKAQWVADLTKKRLKAFERAIANTLGHRHDQEEPHGHADTLPSGFCFDLGERGGVPVAWLRNTRSFPYCDEHQPPKTARTSVEGDVEDELDSSSASSLLGSDAGRDSDSDSGSDVHEEDSQHWRLDAEASVEGSDTRSLKHPKMDDGQYHDTDPDETSGSESRFTTFGATDSEDEHEKRQAQGLWCSDSTWGEESDQGQAGPHGDTFGSSTGSEEAETAVKLTPLFNADLFAPWAIYDSP